MTRATRLPRDLFRFSYHALMPQPLEIATRRLTLIKCDEERLATLIAGTKEYEERYRSSVEPRFIEFEGAFEYSLGKALASGLDAMWWLPFLIVHAENSSVIGVVGFKGPPTQDGFLEIGYSIAQHCQNQGLATEAVEAMIQSHNTLPEIAGFRAHTLPEHNASCRVLEKAGFSRAGDYFDPEDGLVWTWQIQ